MTKLPIIVGRTAAGGTLYAAITVAPPALGSPRRGIVAHSAEVALLAPFASVDEAVVEIERLGRGTTPTGSQI